MSLRMRSLLSRSVLSFSLLLAVVPAAFAQSTGTGYHVARKIVLGGEGGWDYLTVDTASHRLYIGRTDRVVVVDLDSAKIVGEVPGLKRGHGVAIARDFGRAFA